MKLSFLTILNETRPDKFYLTAFNKSTVPVLGSIKTDSAGTMSPVLLKDLSTEARLELIQRIKRIVPAELTKYEPYFVSQVMQGNLKLNKIEEDSERLVNAINWFVRLSRKANWEGPTDLFKWPDWRLLERKVTEFADKNVDYDEVGADESEMLYKKSYENNALSLVLGGPPEITTYWFRSVKTPRAATKYGKGTQWCTSSNSNLTDPDNSYAASYIKSGGLYIVEIQTPTKSRHPALQISGEEFMSPEDVPVSRLGPRAKDFFRSVLAAAADKIHPNTAAFMQAHVEAPTRTI